MTRAHLGSVRPTLSPPPLPASDTQPCQPALPSPLRNFKSAVPPVSCTHIDEAWQGERARQRGSEGATVFGGCGRARRRRAKSRLLHPSPAGVGSFRPGRLQCPRPCRCLPPWFLAQPSLSRFLVRDHRSRPSLTKPQLKHTRPVFRCRPRFDLALQRAAEHRAVRRVWRGTAPCELTGFPPRIDWIFPSSTSNDIRRVRALGFGLKILE